MSTPTVPFFVPNPNLVAALEAEVRKSGALEHVAEEAAGVARAIAPVDTGTYRDSIGVESADSGTRLVALAPYSTYLEVGTSDTEAFHVLTRAVESIGLSIGGRG